MSHSTKRPRFITVEEQDDTIRRKQMTWKENLRGSTIKLASAVNTLGKTVNKLDLAAASMQQFCTMAKMERSHILVTNQDIDYAQSVVSKEAMPEIESFLKEAQVLIDQMGVMAMEKKRKDNAMEQGITSWDSMMMPPPLPARKEDYEMELLQVDEQMQACQSRRQALAAEINGMEDTLAKLDLELDQLEKELASQTAEAAAAIEQKTMEDDEEEEEEEEKINAQWLEWNEEEARLMEELESIRRQQQLQLEKQQLQQQQQQQQQLELEQQQQMGAEKKNKKTQAGPTKDDELAIMQECIDHLRTSPDDAKLLDLNDLKSYLVTLEEENNKILSTLESKITINRNLLKIYCRNILPNKSMGYVARQLMDHLFTDQGYQAMTPKELIKLFDSPRHKELVEQFLDRYPLPSTE